MNEMFAKNFEQEDQERQERRKEGESCNKKSTEDDDDMYYTKNSNTSSGDSGYGTHHQRTKETRLKAQDVFESVEKKSSRKNSINSSKLSLFFSTKSRNKKEPHFVKFQTWSNSNNKFNHSQEQQHHRKSSSTVHGSPVEEVHQPELMLLPIARRKSSSSLDDATCANHLKLFDEYGNLQAKYKLGNVIGKGHFGTVYRALDLLSGKTVAIKQIDLKSSKKQDIKDMIQEAKLLSSLVHPNIVKYEGFIQTQDHINIVLEYVENGSLLNTLKSFGNSLPEHLVACYCQRILKGLTYLHQQHVVHCDLKAANILTTKSGDVKLSDFGVSLNLKLKKNEDENAVSGTPFWMSPEVIELKGASIKSDIWSLGCTIIELCTGKPPYSDLMAMSAMFKIVEEDHPPIPNNISTELKDFLKLCFKKDPSQRPSTNELLRHTWILQQQPLDIISTTSSSSMLIKKSTAHKSNSSATVFSSKHVHSLIDCSFSKEAGTCKACDLPIKRNAFVCKDFCGYICHKQCNTLNRNPKPTISVSTQLRDKFSFSKLIITHTHEQSQKWWKRKPSPKEIR